MTVWSQHHISLHLLPTANILKSIKNNQSGTLLSFLQKYFTSQPSWFATLRSELEKALSCLKCTHFSGFGMQRFRSRCLPVYLWDQLRSAPSPHPAGGCAYPPAPRGNHKLSYKEAHTKKEPQTKTGRAKTWLLSARTECGSAEQGTEGVQPGEREMAHTEGMREAKTQGPSPSTSKQKGRKREATQRGVKATQSNDFQNRTRWEILNITGLSLQFSKFKNSSPKVWSRAIRVFPLVLHCHVNPRSLTINTDRGWLSSTSTPHTFIKYLLLPWLQ